MSRSRLQTLAPRVPPASPERVATMVPGSWRSSDMTSSDRGYDGRWRSFREKWLRLHPLCGDRAAGPSTEHSRCRAAGRAVPATDVDHVIAHRGDEAKFWDEGNLQSLCHSCHSAKTAAEAHEGEGG